MAIYKTAEGFDLSKLQIGDLVSYDLMYSIITNGGKEKPRLLIPEYALSGQHRIMHNRYTGKKRAVYHSFLLAVNGLWVYKGECGFFDWEHPECSSVHSAKEAVLCP